MPHAPNLLIRPIRLDDLDTLCELAKESGIGFTSLPYDEAFLRNKIQLSLDSFARPDDRLDSENYLFVLEDTATGNVVGTTAVAENVGKHEVFYTYKVGRLTKACKSLGIRVNHQTLTLTTDHEGTTELCTLFVSPEYRGTGAGELLSRCRYLFMSEFSHRFSDIVIAEMRGVSDETGCSPFWEAVGKKFFGNVKFPQADHLTGMGEKQFIADLMPEFRLYVCMLPESAQQAIGRMHPKTQPAGRLLAKENFHYRGYIDIFDGGPTLEARKHNIRSMKLATRATVMTVADNVEAFETYIISNTDMDFRATFAKVQRLSEDKVAISPELAQILQVKAGDKIRLFPMDRPPK